MNVRDLIIKNKIMQNKQVEQFIMDYAEAVDVQDITKVGSFLDSDFRIIMKSNKEKNKTTVLTKADYLNLIEEKIVGGLKRTVRIISCTQFSGTVNVLVILESEKMLMESVYNIIDSEGSWKLISDLLWVTFK